MALDVGTKTIGIAVSDELAMIANGVETIHRTSKERDYARLQELVVMYKPAGMVIGYPKNMNGSIGARAQSCQNLADELGKFFPDVKMILWDERLSTVAAQRVLIEADLSRAKRKKIIDKMAAVVILQNYLDSRR